MAKSIKLDNKRNDADNLNSSSFRQYLYSKRMGWVKHVIPVRYKDPDIGVFMEGYIVSKIAKDTDTEEESEESSFEELYNPSEQSDDDLVTVRCAYLSNKFHPIKKVKYEDLYPSKRTLTVIKNTEKMGEVTLQPLYQEDISMYEPTEQLPIEKLMEVFESYPGIHWTIPEMACIVNRPIKEVEEFTNLELLPSYLRVCKITHTEQFTYMQKVIEAKKIEEKDETHKICRTVETLYSQYSTCSRCDLGIRRMERGCHTVPARGNSKSPKFFFLGEAPGVQEESDGIPFHPNAPAGSLFKDTLINAGFDKKDCYITNAVICRPPAEKQDKAQNSKPKPHHLKACSSRLKNELVIVNPRIIVLLGKTAYEAYFGKEPDGVLKSVGWIIPDKIYFVVHPSYIARQSGTTNGKILTAEYIDHFKIILEAGNRPI